MYNSLTGKITEIEAGRCCIEVTGIEYALSITTGTAAALSKGRERRVLVYLYHKEDQLKLFGFADELEREYFLKLLKVSGIGPSLALKILSGLSPKRLSAAIEAGDVGALSSVPGLGKKSAQKIILALQGTLASVAPGQTEPDNEIVVALVEMGFDRSAAAGAVRTSSMELPEGLSPAEREERLLKESIVAMTRGGA